MRAMGIESGAYKKKTAVGAVDRTRMLRELRSHVDIGEALDANFSTDDALDAVFCLIAARDYLEGNVLTPSDGQLTTAKKEGWIWVRDPAT